MPQYTVKLYGHDYDVNSEQELTDEQAYAFAKIQADEEMQAQRDHLADVSSKPSNDELALQRKGEGTMWEGMKEAGEGIGYGLLNTVAHPIETAKNIGRAQVDEFRKAGEEFSGDKQGHTLAGIGHSAAGLLPLLGPLAANVGEDAGEAEQDPRAMGRAFVNGSALLGPGAGKAVKDFGPGVAEFGTNLATKHPGVVAGVAGGLEGFHQAGWPGAALGAIGVPTGLKAAGAMLKQVLEKGEEAAKGQGAAEAFSEGVTKAKLSPKTGGGPPTPNTPPAGPKPVKPKTPKSPRSARAPEQDMAGAPPPLHPNGTTAFEEAMTPGVNRSEPLAPKPGSLKHLLKNEKTVPDVPNNPEAAAVEAVRTGKAPLPVKPKSIDRPSRSKAARGKENGYSANDEAVAKVARDEGLTGSEVHERVLKERAARRGPNYDKKKAEAAKKRDIR